MLVRQRLGIPAARAVSFVIGTRFLVPQFRQRKIRSEAIWSFNAKVMMHAHDPANQSRMDSTIENYQCSVSGRMPFMQPAIGLKTGLGESLQIDTPAPPAQCPLYPQ